MARGALRDDLSTSDITGEVNEEDDELRRLLMTHTTKTQDGLVKEIANH